MIDKLHYISQETDSLSHLDAIKEACIAGCKWIQLRMKDKNETEMLSLAEQSLKVCREFGAKLIINDHVEIAKKIQADGVHLGQNDMPPSEAREMLGNEVIIGGTANTYADIVWLAEYDVNYIGLGPFRFTQTKENLSPVLGLEGYQETLQKARYSRIEIPVIAIGGIQLEDVAQIMETGAHGIAVSGLITNSENKQQLVEQLYQILEKKS